MEPCKYSTPINTKSINRGFLYYKLKSPIEGGISMIKIKLKDGSIKEVEAGKSVYEVAKEISEGLARVATCASVDEKVVDLRYVLNKDCELTIHTFESSLEGKKAYWHTSSHIMAQAIKRINPETKLANGPSIDEGFYYAFDVEKNFTD